MNVAVAFPGCHRRGGVERVTFECARYLAGRGHRVTVLASEWETDPSPNIRYQHVPARRRPGFLRGPSYFRNCTDQLTSFRPDVVNTHGCVCPTGGVHWVQSLHRAWLDRSRSFRAPFSFKRIRQRLNPLHPMLLRLEAEHFGRRRYRKIIATTEVVKDDLHRYYDVPGDDVVIIPNGFSPEEFNPARRHERRAEMRRRLGLADENLALLFVAHELERKGYRTILEALSILKREELRLLVVGRPDARRVRALAERYGVAAQVIACGPSADVSAYHAAADAFVLPTQYEAFCLAILEALGSGLPVITSDVPGARDAIVPGGNGVLVKDPEDGRELAAAIDRVLDPRTLPRLSGNAAASVSSYQWPEVLGRYERVLMENCR